MSYVLIKICSRLLVFSYLKKKKKKWLRHIDLALEGVLGVLDMMFISKLSVIIEHHIV